MEECSCWVCRHPSERNARERAEHAVNHEIFALYVAPDLCEFRPPEPERIAAMTYAEWHAPRLCQRAMCTGLPAHAAGHR